MQAEPLSAADGRARAWMGQGGEAGADAPHASSRARRVERRLVGASDGAFGRRNASEACQRDGLVPRNCNALGSRTSRGGPPDQIWARPSPRAVAAFNRALERGWSAGWGGGSSGVAGARGGVNVLRAPAKTHAATGEPKARRLEGSGHPPFYSRRPGYVLHKCYRARRAPPRRCYAALTVTYLVSGPVSWCVLPCAESTYSHLGALRNCNVKKTRRELSRWDLRNRATRADTLSKRAVHVQPPQLSTACLRRPQHELPGPRWRASWCGEATPCSGTEPVLPRSS